MDIKMKKNNKMFLVLVVVAALALVSVAAVAAHSSNAAGTYWQMTEPTNNKLVIDETSTMDWNIVVPDTFTGTAACEILITANAKYTGTLTVGTLSSDLVFTPYAAMKLTDASNVQLIANMDCTSAPIACFNISNMSIAAGVTDGAYTLTDGVPAGTFVLTQGYVTLGATIDGVDIPFCGTVSAGSFSMAAEYVSGATVAITDDGSALLSGKAVAIIDDPVSAPAGFVNPDGALTLSGPASIQTPPAEQLAAEMNGDPLDLSFTSEVNVTVNDGAVITAGDAAPMLAETVTIETGPTDNFVAAILVDSNGNSFAAKDLSGPIEFKFVPFGSYTLFAITDAGAVYKGTATVNDTTLTLGLGSNALSEMVPMANDVLEIGIDSSAGKLTFSQKDFVFTFALWISAAGDKAAIGKLDSSGIISFGANEVTTADTIFVVLTQRITGGDVQCYYGNPEGTNDLTAITPIAVITSNDPVDGQIKAGAVEVGDTVATFGMLDESTLLVKGTMNFLWTSTTNKGELNLKDGNAYLEFDGNGIVSHAIDTLFYPAAGNTMAEVELPLVFGSDNLNVVYYITNDDTNKISTYKFTTLENAKDNTESNTIFLEGHVVIKENTTLSNSAGDLTVILTNGSTLEVGVRDDPATTDVDEGISAILTIPESTQLIISDPDSYSVENGKAVYDVQPTGNNEPLADILIAGSKYTYTDIATALDSAVNGDVLTLRQDASLNRDATVGNGVTLNDSVDGMLTIPEGKTLTVNGTLTSINGMVIDGTLLVNGTVNFDDATDVTLDGFITVASNGTLNITNGAIISPGANDTGTLSVEGKVNVSSGSDVEVSTVSVGAGTLTISNAVFIVGKSIVIGVQPTVSTDNVNRATISGVITLGDNALATVYGNVDLSKNFDSDNGVVSVVYKIGLPTYVTLYCDNNSGIAIPMLYEDDLLDITISDWNTDRNMRGDSLFENQGTLIGEPGWEIVYADYSAKMYTVTVSYLQGLTWIVNGTVPSDGTVQIAYGASVTVTTAVQPGFAGTPNLTVNGAPYTAGQSYKVVGNTIFAATGVDIAGAPATTSSGLTLIEYLLIIIVIIIAIIAIIIAIRLLRS